MRYKGLVWVASIATIFLFLPSLAFKLWEFLTGAPWYQKSWFFYLLASFVIVQAVKYRWRLRKKQSNPNSPESLIFLAKQRLVKGELSIEEFRQIREELKQS